MVHGAMVSIIRDFTTILSITFYIISLQLNLCKGFYTSNELFSSIKFLTVKFWYVSVLPVSLLYRHRIASGTEMGQAQYFSL